MSNRPLITDEPLWDRVVVLSTTSPLDLAFFSCPRGTCDPNDNYGVKTLADTNMTQYGGRLPSCESFLAHAVELVFDVREDACEDARDADRFWSVASLEIIGDCGRTVLFRAPLATAKGDRIRFDFKRPLFFASGEPVGARIVLSHTPSLSRDHKVMCVLRGDHCMVPVAPDILVAEPREDGRLCDRVEALEKSLALLLARDEERERDFEVLGRNHATLARRHETLLATVEAMQREPEPALAALSCARCSGELAPLWGDVEGAAACLSCWLAAQPARCQDCREPCAEAEVAERDGEMLTCVSCWERRAAFDAARVLRARGERAALEKRIVPTRGDEMPAPRRLLSTKRLAQLVSLATIAGVGLSAAVARVVCP